MEGALLVRGASSRRLGHRTRPYAVFPFISQSLQPETESEVGQKAAGEFWAPLWDNPATFGEVRALFQRGLARLGGRAAIAPHEFAVAALARGTDAGSANLFDTSSARLPARRFTKRFRAIRFPLPKGTKRSESIRRGSCCKLPARLGLTGYRSSQLRADLKKDSLACAGRSSASSSPWSGY